MVDNSSPDNKPDEHGGKHHGSPHTTHPTGTRQQSTHSVSTSPSIMSVPGTSSCASSTSATPPHVASVVLTSSVCTTCPSMSSMPSNNPTAPMSTIVHVTTADTSTTSVASTLTATPATISNSTSAKGFFQTTGAVAGTFTAVGLVFLALLTFLATCLVRRRRQVIFDREAFVETTSRLEPAPIDDRHNSPHEDAIMHSDASIHGMYVRQSPTTTSTEGYVTTMEKNAYGVAGVGARYRTGYDGADNLQYQVYTDDVHRSQQDVWHNASANPIHTSFVSTLYASDNSPRPKQAPRMSQDSQAQRSGHRYYSQLLKAAGLEPESCSSHSSSGGIGRGMWSHGHKLHVFPDSYEELKAQQSPPTQVSAGAQPGGTAAAGMNDAYGGYVDEYENVH